MHFMPRVSIGMPVYNGARFLQEALDSILAQDFTDFELIISDNASTDDTESICRRCAERDGRILYYRNGRNMGAAWNYNRLVAPARGEYFRWAAHDDIWAPAALRCCVQTLEAGGERVVLAYPKTFLIDECGSILGPHEDELDLRHPLPHQRLKNAMYHYGLCNPVFGLIRMSALRQTRLFGKYNASDTVLLGELSMLGEFREVPERLFLRRYHGGMSCLANQKLSDRAAWFDPANKGKRGHAFFVLRMFVEHLRAVRALPLDSMTKLKCYSVTGIYWMRRWKDFGGDFKRAVKTLVANDSV